MIALSRHVWIGRTNKRALLEPKKSKSHLDVLVVRESELDHDHVGSLRVDLDLGSGQGLGSVTSPRPQDDVHQHVPPQRLGVIIVLLVPDCDLIILSRSLRSSVGSNRSISVY